MPCKILATALPENFSSLRVARKLLMSALIWSSQSDNCKAHQKNLENWNTRTLQDQITAEDFSDQRVPSTLYLESSSTSCEANMWLRSRRLSKYSERRPFSWRLRLSSKSSTQDETLRKPTLQQQPGSFTIINRQVRTAYTQITAYFGEKKQDKNVLFFNLLKALKQAVSW